MVAEPTHNRKEQREKMVELLFEKFAPPALFLAKNSVLSSFAVGRPTSLVIDCGASGALPSRSGVRSRTVALTWHSRRHHRVCGARRVCAEQGSEP